MSRSDGLTSRDDPLPESRSCIAGTTSAVERRRPFTRNARKGGRDDRLSRASERQHDRRSRARSGRQAGARKAPGRGRLALDPCKIRERLADRSYPCDSALVREGVVALILFPEAALSLVAQRTADLVHSGSEANVGEGGAGCPMCREAAVLTCAPARRPEEACVTGRRRRSHPVEERERSPVAGERSVERTRARSSGFVQERTGVGAQVPPAEEAQEVVPAGDRSRVCLRR
jgi:hypothetical protein